MTIVRSAAELQQLVGVAFRNPDLLRQAFVHKSYLNENPDAPIGCNERLEFLGDAFLGYVVGAHLYTTEPDASEGDLTKRRAALVQRDTLAAAAKRLDWGVALLMGAGEEERGGRARTSTLGNLFEAVVGAVLLDQGEDVARRFVLGHLQDGLRELEAGLLAVDYKSRLQELCQARRWDNPSYRVLAEMGPAHARRYRVEVLVRGDRLGEGEGSSRQRAEKEAARGALERLEATDADAPAL